MGQCYCQKVSLGIALLCADVRLCWFSIVFWHPSCSAPLAFPHDHLRASQGSESPPPPCLPPHFLPPPPPRTPQPPSVVAPELWLWLSVHCSGFCLLSLVAVPAVASCSHTFLMSGCPAQRQSFISDSGLTRVLAGVFCSCYVVLVLFSCLLCLVLG